jgi:two-component system chemotaxis sensor kinase CheA
VEGCRFGIIVDSVHNIEEIVVKPLNKQLQALQLFGGATILGDGRIVLIIDPPSMLHHLRLIRPDAVDPHDAETVSDSAQAPLPHHSYLIVDTDMSRRTAVPLQYVQRIEKMPATALERVNSTDVIQYRGRLLPIVCHASSTTRESSPAAEMVVVVLSNERGQSLGLHVRGIIDICDQIQDASAIQLNNTEVERMDIIAERASLIVDIPRLFDSIYGPSFTQPEPSPKEHA